MANPKRLSIQEIIKSLHSKLKPVQKQMWTEFLSNTHSLKSVFHCSRRLGKSFLLCVLALTFAYSKPNAQIRYASVTQKAVRKMIFPIVKELQSSIPTSQRGVWNSQEGAYIFPNGSMIHIAGVNNGRSDDLRGTAADLCIVDEAAFVDELSYLVDSVLMPQLITTKGKLIMASSSPLSPAHEFVGYIEDAQLNKSYSSYTIYDAGYDAATIELFCKETGGATSTAWRREYLNELIVDTELSIIPEWDDSCVQELQKDEFYNYYHKYESCDWGVRDKTAVLFGHYNFKKAVLYIEDEFTASNSETLTRNIANNIKSTERTLGWKQIYRRVADSNNLQVIQDMGAEYGVHFAPTNKDTLAAMVNEVRLMVKDKRIIVSPKCTELIGCLKYGVFQDSKRKEFGRSKAFGHYDALASLIYLVRNLDLHTNPIPASHGASIYTHYIPQDEGSNAVQEIKKIFNL